MNFIPMDEKVLLIMDADKAETETASGLIIPETAQKRHPSSSGTVIAVGTNPEMKLLIKVGDTVVFARYGGEDVTVDGIDYKVVKRAEILGVSK